jgi:type I restriction enzyme S subunit
MNSKSVVLQLTRLTTGSTFGRINLDLIRNFLIPYPNESNEENKIADILQGQENIMRRYKNYVSSLNNLKQGLMQKLLTGKIRVKV